MGKPKRKSGKNRVKEELDKKTKTNNKGNNGKEDKNNKDNKGKKKGFWKRHRKLALALKIMIVIIILLCIVGVGAIIAILNNDEWALTEKDLILSNIDTIIYDKDGNEIANLSGDEKRRTITLDEIPENLKDAYISIEDERFYDHKGVDIKRTLAATVTYVINAGHSSYGGSTITQQLIKNLKDETEDSGIAGIQRKIREMSRSYKLEKMISKDQILELYLNTIFVGGSNVCGVELGARYYFNKSAKDLSLAECAFMAGINHSPNNYNPFTETDRKEKIKNRTETVLDKMLELKKINQEEYESAIAELNEGLKFENGTVTTATSMSYLARSALNQVISQYAEQNDVSNEIARNMIEGGGYKIYTTQDSGVQYKAEQIYKNSDYVYSGRNKDSEGNLINTHTQSAIVIIDHKTGQVVGCMGGLGNDVDSNGLNRATQSTRQPGSSIKPIASIAPALEAGVITASTIYDESSTSFGSYRPTNSNKGLITVREAIKISANTTEVKIMSELGPSKAIEYMKKMGITTLVTPAENSEHNDENLAMVLGGLTNGISPLEMAGAYSMIANGGTYITPTFYTKVENSLGETILEPKQDKTRVISEANAYILQTILEGPVSSGGTAPYCKISGMATGGKTGTTTSDVDRWFCGFTPYYTAAAWYGFDKNQEPLTGQANVSNKAARLWDEVMEDIHKDLSNAEFERPSNVVSAKVCLDSGKLATDDCSRTYTEYFVRGTVPSYCEGHVKLTICKTTGKIATEYCTDTEEKIYTAKPEKENTTMWQTNSGDKYDIPTDTCDTHTTKVINIPNVVGKTRAQAVKALEDLGLIVKVETETSTKEDDIVLSQNKNTTAKTGETITIVVSKKSSSAGGNTEPSGNEQSPDGNSEAGNNTSGGENVVNNEI